MVIAHHLVLTAYGHWLPNDPRGSMSAGTHTPGLARLGPGHLGRKEQQPPRGELRKFHRQAEEVLSHPVLWFDPVQRDAVVGAVGETIAARRLTCYACAVLTDHVHLLIRRHRVSGQRMVPLFKDRLRDRLLEAKLVPPDHPVWSRDVCVLFKSDPRSVWTCVAYINGNFARHGLPTVIYDFVTPYDDWPFHKRRPGTK